MDSRKRIKHYKSLIIFLSILSGLVLVSFLVFELLDLFPNSFIIPFVYIVVIPVSVFLLIICAINYRNLKQSVKTIEGENMYNLGIPSHCYNYPIFDRIVEKAINAHKSNGSYIIAFTVSKISTIHNSSIRQVNALLSKFLSKTLFNDSKLSKVNNIYCYYHGAFVIYSFEDLIKIKDTINVITEEIYKIAKENDIKAFIQPYFGLQEVKVELSLMEEVENALVAREAGEKRFEDVTFYSPDLRKDASLKEIEDIKKAIANDELVVYYQPKFSLNNKQFISSEALVRWNSPEKGLLSPAKFINKAEVSGLIHEIDMTVLKKVCKDLAYMRKRGDRLLPVSVNFSLYEFYNPNFLNELFDICYQSGVDTHLIEIEITETTTQANPFMSISILKKLKEHGFRILMDDFGLGFSNLGNLNRLPFDAVKIDKSFVDGLITDSKSRDIVKFLIALCKTNNMEVIAEGVDKVEEVNILKSAKCDTIQGYYYSKPIPRDEFIALLDNNPFEKKEDKE